MEFSVVGSILMLVNLLSLCSSKNAFKCQSNSDCNTGFCCSKKPRYQLVSRREVDIPPLSEYVSSRCEPYLPLNDSCAYAWKVNGDCGCAPGLECKYFPERDRFNMVHPVYELLSPGAKRKRDMMAGDPDAYVCSPIS